MSAPAPGPQPGQLTPEQIAQFKAHFEAEAQRRGITPEQLQAQQRQEIAKEAAKHNVSPQQYVEMMRAKAMQEQLRAQQGQQGQQAQGKPQMQQISLTGGVEAKPEALALARFLRREDLKTRTCILEGIRRDMFRVKRALRALQSEKYEKARAKDPLLPEAKTDEQARKALIMLPLSVLALRVEKVDPNAGHEGHNHAPKKEKRVKGLWKVKVAPQQDFEPDMYFAWIYEESSWKTKIYAGLAVIIALAAVLFPLWPLFMRQGVWYLSVGLMGLLGLFFAMAIFRLILFCLTIFTIPPGFWLYPNLFEDVGFFDSFRPVYGWGDNKKPKKKKAKEAVADTVAGAQKAAEKGSKKVTNGVATAAASTTGSAPLPTSAVGLTKRHEAPRVEEAGDDEE